MGAKKPRISAKLVSAIPPEWVGVHSVDLAARRLPCTCEPTQIAGRNDTITIKVLGYTVIVFPTGIRTGAKPAASKYRISKTDGLKCGTRA